MGIKRIEKIRNEEIRTRANIRENKRIETEMVSPRGENDLRSCSNENMEDGSGWTTRDWITETEVE